MSKYIDDIIDDYNKFDHDDDEYKNWSKLEKKIILMIKKHDAHRGEWLTEYDAKEYCEKARVLSSLDSQDIGARRELRIELQEQFGLTQVEAINILNGCHIDDYVTKYDHIKNIFIEGEEEQPSPELIEALAAVVRRSKH